MMDDAPYCIWCGNVDLDDDSYCKFCDVFANLIWEDIDADSIAGGKEGNNPQPKRDSTDDLDF